MRQNLEKYRDTIDLKNTGQTGLSDLVAIEQFELLGAFVEIVAELRKFLCKTIG